MSFSSQICSFQFVTKETALTDPSLVHFDNFILTTRLIQFTCNARTHIRFAFLASFPRLFKSATTSRTVRLFSTMRSGSPVSDKFFRIANAHQHRHRICDNWLDSRRNRAKHGNATWHHLRFCETENTSFSFLKIASLFAGIDALTRADEGVRF